MLDGTIRMMPQIVNTLRPASLVGGRDHWHPGEGPIPDDVIAAMGRELGVGRWMMRCALFDDEAVIDHRFAKIRAAFERAIPGCEIWGTKHSPDEIAGLENPSEVVGGGAPSLAFNAQTAWYGGDDGGHVGFSPIGPLTGEDAIAIRDLMRSAVEDAGLDYMGAFLPVTARAFVHVDADPLRHEERGAGPDRLRRRRATGAGSGTARLRRVPGAPGLHGRRRGGVLVQRPRVPAVQRDDQGRARPQRHPLPGQAGDLAPAVPRPTARGRERPPVGRTR